MNGKVVVITGGTSGIGQVAAEKLAGMGARIVIGGARQVSSRLDTCAIAANRSRR